MVLPGTDDRDLVLRFRAVVADEQPIAVGMNDQIVGIAESLGEDRRGPVGKDAMDLPSGAFVVLGDDADAVVPDPDPDRAVGTDYRVASVVLGGTVRTEIARKVGDHSHLAVEGIDRRDHVGAEIGKDVVRNDLIAVEGDSELDRISGRRRVHLRDPHRSLALEPVDLPGRDRVVKRPVGSECDRGEEAIRGGDLLDVESGKHRSGRGHGDQERGQ